MGKYHCLNFGEHIEAQQTNQLTFVEGSISPQQVAGIIQQYTVDKQVGAHSLFLGQVRNDIIDFKEVQAIEYTAYLEMVHKQFEVLKSVLFEEFDITGLQVLHSIGVVECGGISLFVLTTSQHRKSAIAACSTAVDRIKETLPIWGKELFKDGGYVWKENQEQ